MVLEGEGNRRPLRQHLARQGAHQRPVHYISVESPAWLQQLPSPLTQPRDLADLPCITLGYGDFQNQLRWEPLARTDLPPIELTVPPSPWPTAPASSP